MKEFNNGIALLPDKLKKLFSGIPENIAAQVREIRFRSNEVIALNTQTGVYYITPSGELSKEYTEDKLKITDRELQELVFLLARRSLHTYQDMIAKGYIPLHGGCKAGVAGRAVMKDGVVYSVSAFNSVNIRISREYRGCCSDVISHIGDTCRSFLVVGPPMSGKTTLLRDLCRYYSHGGSSSPVRVAVVDERDEIASRAFGSRIDIGVHTDVLSLYPKAVGTDIAVRTLSPEIVVLDEIGAADEVEAILSAVNTGVGFIATAHGGSLADVMNRPNIKRLADGRAFEKIVVLEGSGSPCKVKELISL